MIVIKNISGATLASVPITQSCKLYRELMGMNYIELSWDDDRLMVLPEGSYIEHGGEVWRLHSPYVPTYVNEAAYRYTPRFYDKVAGWSLKPLFLVTDRGEETDWSITAYPGQLLEIITRAIKKYTGEVYTYSVDASLAQKTMEAFTFQNVSIFEGLNQVATKWSSDWWIEGNVIHLSKCQQGAPITLEVGKNIGVPSVTEAKDGYFTRFYAFGSTKNITQEYNDSGFTNGLVNKRLTLDPSVYPGGYIDIRPNLSTHEAFVKTLIFDDIFPADDYSISAVRGDLRDWLDESGNKIQVGESGGKPIYQQYTVWYFKIAGFTLNNTTYDPKDNPGGMLLPGLDLSVVFNSGQLNGREFKLIYHADSKEYEISYIKDGNTIVPGQVMLIPTDGDKISLFNLRISGASISQAQKRLAERLQEEMQRYRENRNSYTFPSYPVAFEEQQLDMNVGQAVRFVSSEGTLETRVLKVEKQLDYPIEQTITIGAEKIKGNTQEIKEEVIDAHQNIDVVKTLADLNKSIQDGYGRVQQLIIESMSKYKGLWRLNQNGAPGDPTKWTVDTDYNVFTKGDLVAFATVTDDSKMDLPVSTDYVTTGLFRAKERGGLVYDPEANAWKVDSGMVGGLDEEKLKLYLDNNRYVNQQWLEQNGYMNLNTKLTGYQKITPYTPITPTDSLLTALGKLEGNFGNYVDLTTNQTIGGVKTFKEVIFGQKDIVAYNSSNADLGLPVATDYVTTGLFRALSGGGLIYQNGGWRIDPSFQGGGGLDKIDVSQSGTGNAVTSVTWNSTYKRLDVTKGTSFALSGHSHDYAASNHGHSLSSLNNDMGFIYDENGNITKLTNSGNATQYLAGDGSFYTIKYSELSGLPALHSHDNKNYLDVINQNLSTTSSVEFDYIRVTTSVIAGVGVIAPNILATQLVSSQGDVEAYSSNATFSEVVPIASTTSYGLVKYDNNTIKKNSSGQLYCTVQGGGGSSPITSVTANTLTAGSNATASYSNGRLTLGIPRGNTGATGPQGPPGKASNWLQVFDNGTDRCVVTPADYPSAYIGVFGGRFGDYWQYLFCNSGTQTAIGWLTSKNSGKTTVMKMTRSGTTVNITAASGSFSNGSDARLKKIFSTSDIRINDIVSINSYLFRWKNEDDSAPMKCGVMAQDLLRNEKFKPFVFSSEDENGNNWYSVDYAGFATAISLAAVKELYSRFSPIESKVKSIEARMETAEAKLNHAWEEIFKLKGGNDGTTQ